MAVATPASAYPPGPKGHFLAGHLPELRRDWLGVLTRYAREFGDFVPLRLGPKRAVLLSHPDYIEDVLVTHNRAFIKSLALRNSRRLFGDGLVTSEGESWLRQRRLVQPAFHRQRIAAYGDRMVACAERMLAEWRSGEERDIQQDLTRLTLEIVAEALFGADLGEQAADVAQALTVALERFERRIGSLLFLLPDSLPLPGNLRYLRMANRLDEIVLGIISRRRASGEERGDLLSMLLQAQDEDGSRMTDRQLRDQVMSLLVAGHETTAITLSWACYLLARHPEVETTLVRELEQALGGRAPTAADLSRLRYTEQVVLETLRLYPTSWVIARAAVRECPIGPYRVERGTVIVMSQWILHRDPRYFPDPERFWPERWADGLADRLPRFAYFPFGGGPRVCIGNAFASMEAVLILATVVQRFRLRLRSEHPVAPWASATLRPKHGVRMVLESRDTAGSLS